MKKILAAMTLIGVVAVCCHMLGRAWEDCMRNSTQPDTECAGNNDPDATNYTIPVPETGTR